MIELQEAVTADSAVDATRSAGMRMPDSQAVRSYIADHLDMAPLVERLAWKVGSAFASDANLSPEIYRDPEIDDHYLSLYVRKPELSAADLETIDRLSEEFADALATASGWLAVLPDYRPSR